MNNDNNIDINNLSLASNKKRFYSFAIDDLLITLIAIFLLWTPIKNTSGSYEDIVAIVNAAFIQIVFIKLIYQAFFIWYYGATLGKMVVKIKVIDFNHFGKITFSQSVLRSASRILSESIFYIGYMLSFYTQSRQTLHDKIAKTLVVDA